MQKYGMKRKTDSPNGDHIDKKQSKVEESSQSPEATKRLCNGLYFTKVQGLSMEANKNTYSLYQLINRINPIASIHFNYCMDPHFILGEYPKRCRQLPITLVVGEQHAAELREACAEFPNITIGRASLPFPYGTHHSKLSLFESEDALHVLISTANLIAQDYGLKTQCFYYFKAPFQTSDKGKDGDCAGTSGDSCTSTLSSLFRDELIDYLKGSYANKTFISYWLGRLRDGNADFSANRDRIIASRPGRFVDKQMHNYGHMNLRRVLAEKFSSDELKRHKIKIAQFSSVGSLGSHAQSWLCDEFLRSLSGGTTANMNPKDLKLIYPSVTNVCESLEGYDAGKSLPYVSRVHSRQSYLKEFLYQWKSESHERTKAMPHVKSYTALDAVTGEPQWLLITSANLSQAAWGRLEKTDSQIFCRSYELGVLLCAKDHPELQNDKSGLPIPYDLPLTKYGSADKPFLCDLRYDQADAMGRRSVMECD